ncbi:hypothetical protein HDE_13996 [Halotydeus destructor]|nr:hypothetical protein HDE_13996 [Halotydeus destructor]
MVIGTKLDMAADVDKVVAEAHEQLFGAQFIFATVSSKTAEGVEEAFDKLIRHTIESRGPKLRPGSDLGGHLSPDSEGNLRHRLACCSLGLPKWLKKLNGHQ